MVKKDSIEKLIFNSFYYCNIFINIISKNNIKWTFVIMKRIEKIFNDLNLIYYEYNSENNSFEADKTYPKENLQNEFLKLTYTLTKNNIDFFVDEKKDIVVSHKDSFFTRLKQRVKNIFKDIKHSNKNIYVLSDKKVKFAQNLPVIDIQYIEQTIDLDKYDGLIFTSKNGVKAMDTLDKRWRKMSSYVIAPQTAKAVKYYGGNLKFVGKEKHGDEFANELIEELEGKKVLYIGGEKTVSELVSILNGAGVICDKISVYKTICKEYQNKVQLPKHSIFIFSSPSTIECFLKNFKWDKSFKAVCIGKTTAKFFPDYITPYISQTTSLESCVKKALELQNN